MKAILTKKIDEKRQGERLIMSQPVTKKKVYIESYGCQMNFSDSEIVASILQKEGFSTTKEINEANLVFVNTCSIREKAERNIRKRLSFYNSIKRKYNPDMKVGILGCMAERLKEKLLVEEKLVDMVIGPDAYRDIPNLIKEVDDGRKAVNVFLSKEETYADIKPLRLDKNGITAFVSITRGCDNMCTFCVVPFTRGRERSRDPESIVKECMELFNKGYREVTLLGQNVDSYLWYGGGAKKDYNPSEKKEDNVINFAELLSMVAKDNPDLRIRFSTSNPQDMTLEVIHVMKKYSNICDYIHLPVQSGSDSILKKMNRGYTREQYMDLIDNIKDIIPECAISMDMISGFCTETEEDHRDTLSLMDYVKYEYGYMFKYSERPDTPAARKLKDDIPEEIKQKRLAEIINKQMNHSLMRNQEKIGKVYEVLIEGISKKSKDELYGRTTHNSVVVFPKRNAKKGEYVMVKIINCTAATLKGEMIL